MDILQKSFDDAIHSLAESTSQRELNDFIDTQFEGLVAKLPKEILSSIMEDAEEGLAERHSINAQFIKRILLRWKEGFDLLEIHIEIAVEVGESFNDKFRPEAAINNNIAFDVLTRLHAKGCLISKEILVLLKNGYADGAHARWRALHEISVTAAFLAAHGSEATQRYLDHDFVEQYKAASQLNKYQSRLNVSGFNEQETEDFRSQYDNILKKYGQEFKKPYGWAKPFVNGNLTFSALEDAVGLDHWRPYYKWASQNIHAGSKTTGRSLGLSETEEDILQVGPSNSGMTDPAHSVAISLSQLTCTLLLSSPNLDSLVAAKILISLSNEIGNTFLECSKRTIPDEDVSL